MATGRLQGRHGAGGTGRAAGEKGTHGPCGEPAAPGHGPGGGWGAGDTWHARPQPRGAEAAKRTRGGRGIGAHAPLQVNVTASNTCPLGGRPYGAAVSGDFHLDTLKLFTGGDRRPRATNLPAPALNRHPKTRVSSCKRCAWSHLTGAGAAAPEGPPGHLKPQPSGVKTAVGQSLKQRCTPKNCCKGNQKSRCYGFPTQMGPKVKTSLGLGIAVVRRLHPQQRAPATGVSGPFP